MEGIVLTIGLTIVVVFLKLNVMRLEKRIAKLEQRVPVRGL